MSARSRRAHIIFLPVIATVVQVSFIIFCEHLENNIAANTNMETAENTKTPAKRSASEAETPLPKKYKMSEVSLNL